MEASNIRAPMTLVRDVRLSGAAKLLWLIRTLEVQRQGPVPPASASLVTISGLSRNTVRHALAQLKAAGWLDPKQAHTRTQAQVALPSDLLLDQRVTTQAKLLYAFLPLTADFRKSEGEFTSAELSGLAGLSPNTVNAAIRRLQATGWLQLSQQNRCAPVHFRLCNPVAALRAHERAEAKRRLHLAKYTGEALMRELLSLAVATDEYQDNANPAFLVNPYTDELMQFDRFYPPKVAFEYNGPQHDGPTERFPDQEKAWKQQGRDLMKEAICTRRDIKLVVLRAEDLVLQRVQQMAEGLLPLRKLEGHEPLVKYLQSVSGAYRRKAEQSDHTHSTVIPRGRCITF